MNPYPLLFSPVNVGHLELKNRIVMAPMGTNLANRKGEVTDRLIDYYALRAKGGVGLIVVEGSSIHRSGHAYPFQLCAHSDDHIPGLTALTKAVHEEGSAILLQLHHGGRNTDMRVSGRTPLAPSANRSPVGKITPEAMTFDQIELMVEAHVRAAERAATAGFDGVELHGAHEYLIHQFLSPYCNKRTDEYGGSLENRMRFALDIVKQIRQRLPQIVLSFRLNGTDYVAGGLTPEDSKEIARRLVESGADLISVTGGVFETPHLIIPPLDIPHGTHLEHSAAIKQAVDKPVIGVGRITTPAEGELALKKQQADLIACGRAFLADAQWPLKAQQGQWRSIRRCIGCNQGCIDRFFAEMPITCIVNPRTGYEKELEIKPTASPKKIVVVGAGPAGLEAARVLDRMGHHVILFEQNQEIGGQVNLAMQPPGKAEFGEILKYYRYALKSSRIDLRLGVRASENTIMEELPDAVIIATGSVPLEPDLPGIFNPSVVTAHDILAGRVQAGHKVAVLGGGSMGLETAHFLLGKGCQVTIVEMQHQVGRDIGPARRYLLNRKMRELKLKRLVRCKVRRIFPDRVSYVMHEQDGRRTIQELDGLDTIVNAMGVRPSDTLAVELEGRIANVLVVGDALTPATVVEAVSDGARAAHCIDAA